MGGRPACPVSRRSKRCSPRPGGDALQHALDPGQSGQQLSRADPLHRLAQAHIVGDEEKSRELNRAVAAGWQYSVMSGMIGAYLRDSELDPDEEQFEALNQAIEDLVVGLEPEVLSREVNQEITEITIVFDLYSP